MCQRSIPTGGRGLDIDDEAGFSVSGIIVSSALWHVLSRLLFVCGLWEISHSKYGTRGGILPRGREFVGDLVVWRLWEYLIGLVHIQTCQSRESQDYRSELLNPYTT